MDKYLRPDRFNADPSATNASEDWSHWKTTFNNFIAGNPDFPNTDAAKLQLLINHISPAIFTMIRDCDTFALAMDTLESVFVKPKNEIYARHCLATRRQAPGETVHQYLQALKLLGKECNFSAVSAEQNRNDYIRDSFISGLMSTSIRQRILENTSLSLDQAFEQARALEAAQQNALSFSNPFPSINATEPADRRNSESEIAAASNKTPSCFYCGYRRHANRSQCPAIDAQCSKCKKTGHYSSVCRSAASPNKRFGRPTTAASSEVITSAVVASSTSKGLGRAMVQVTINGVMCTALIDTGSSSSFINSSLIEKCGAIKLPSNEKISMASTSFQSQVEGCCHVNLRMLGRDYRGVKFLIMKNLCADVIIGHDLLDKHTSLEMHLGGPEGPLVCGVATANVPPASLFKNLTQ